MARSWKHQYVVCRIDHCPDRGCAYTTIKSVWDTDIEAEAEVARLMLVNKELVDQNLLHYEWQHAKRYEKVKTYKGTVDPGKMNWSVTVDGEPLDPRWDLANHSPDGFSWGYYGSGPAQLALAILADFTENDGFALMYYQSFKEKVIAQLNQDAGFTLTPEQICAAVPCSKLLDPP